MTDDELATELEPIARQKEKLEALETKEFLDLLGRARRGDVQAAQVVADGYEETGSHSLAEGWRENVDYLAAMKKGGHQPLGPSGGVFIPKRDHNLGHLTPSQVRRVSGLLERSGLGKLPKVGYCKKLPDGSEICHYRNGYSLIGMSRPIYDWVSAKRTRGYRRKRSYGR